MRLSYLSGPGVSTLFSSAVLPPPRFFCSAACLSSCADRVLFLLTKIERAESILLSEDHAHLLQIARIEPGIICRIFGNITSAGVFRPGKWPLRDAGPSKYLCILTGRARIPGRNLTHSIKMCILTKIAYQITCFQCTSRLKYTIVDPSS